MSDPVVHLTNGLPDAGTGNVTTLGQTLLDGANATHGVTTGAAVITDAAGTFQQYLRGIVKLLAGTLTVASHAVTNAGTFAVQAAATLAAETTKVIGVVRTADGSGNLLTSTGGAVDINIKSGANTNSRTTPALSAPVAEAGLKYQAVAASASATALGTGATGDFLSHLICVVATAATSPVSFTDGSGSAINVLPNAVGAGIGAYSIPLGLFSASGAWKVTTGAGVTVVAAGTFTP